MQQLRGRLTALDPEAAESLKVIAHFDALIMAGVGLEGLLRSAAVLSGTVAGAERRSRTTRVGHDGRRLAAGEVVRPAVLEAASSDCRVWLEREGPPLVNDAMVVERLAFAITLLESRSAVRHGLDAVIDAAVPVGERAAVLARLRIDSSTQVRVIATSADDPAPDGGLSTIVATRFGMLRATVDIPVTGVVGTPVGRSGFGVWVRADRAPESWDGAVIAFGLTDREDRTIDATDLGVILQLLQAPDSNAEDVDALERLDPLETTILRTLVEADSVRAAAARLGMHHSTVQARHESLTRALGYDPRTPVGRMRCSAATLVLRLRRADREA
ncbi:hypothetical protein nbrc107696_42530 [Gordonia spumicola]|uniref:PucR C-terminal helix-turn-helix domain-containing protein n=1 Tax=Gordonia spumicola TaxID=589161 RepID=A0A7I9VEQ6_9ACTN|nr:helix-turn-helix domain-containing protein [Gordonia spumicola]GEE03807.1 hypothetical protein nbrc107696_42530 [Gordonia spumicola]